MKLFITLLVALVLMSATISGQKQKPKPCEDAQTQADMNICWGNEYKKADAALNKTYQELAAMLEEEEKASSRLPRLPGLNTATPTANSSPTNIKAAQSGR